MIRSVVRGTGAYLPERVVSNAELALRVDTSDAWIRERTGIAQRHIAADGELTSDLATAAARRALERAGLAPAQIDLIVVATSTPDNTFPAVATAVQRKLGVPPCAAFDLQAVCAGFAYALATADAFLVGGRAKRALVIGAETFSRLLDWSDRSTCVLFGDGAGAVVLEAVADGERGVLSTHLCADGRHYEELMVDGGVSSTGTVGQLRMNGREVFRHAVHDLAEAAQAVLLQAGLRIAEVDWLVPHQANRRIIDAVARRLEIPSERVILTVERHANTSAASIPLALAEAEADGRIRPDQIVLIDAMGGGFAWGACLLRW
jgi:3-oxoacyl-[acyl-carrier-protein] synthase-3